MKVTAYTALVSIIRLVSMTHFNFKAMLTNGTEYTAAIQKLHKLFSQSYGVHIMPLLLADKGQTHTHMPTFYTKHF